METKMRMSFENILEEFEDMEDALLLAELREETNPEKEFQVYPLGADTPEEVYNWSDSQGYSWWKSIEEHLSAGGCLHDIYVLADEQNLFSYGLILEKGTAR